MDTSRSELDQPPQHQADAAIASTVGPRRGTRVKKPTSKALGQDLVATETCVTSTKPQPSISKSQSSKTHKPTDSQEEPDTDNEQSSQDDPVYCICKRKDDGTPMISCEDCKDWFHFRCIGLTQKAAKSLVEYRCSTCSEMEPYNSDEQIHSNQIKTNQARQVEKESPTPTASESQDSDQGDEYIDRSEQTLARGESQAAENMDNHHDESSSNKSDIDQDDSFQKSPLTKAKRTRSGLAHAVESSHSLSSSPVKRKADQDAESSLRKAPRSSEQQLNQKRKSSTSKQLGTFQRRSSGQNYGISKSSPTRKASGSGSGQVSDPNIVDQARSKAVKVLADVLLQIFQKTTLQTSDSTISLDMLDQTKSVEEKALDYASALEEELFEITADRSISGKVVGSKYRDKFRTFLFSLKDKINTSLHTRIVSGELQAKALAHLSSEQLANDTIREATEKARLEALQRSTLRSEKSAPHRKITHKGEIEIEQDDNNFRDQLDKFQTRQDQVTMQDTTQLVSESTSPLKSPPQSHYPTTQKSRQRTDSQTSNSDPNAKAFNQYVSSPTAEFDFSSIWKADPSVFSPREDQEQQIDIDGQPEQEEDNAALPDYLNDANHDGLEVVADASNPSGQADDFIDSFLDANQEPPPSPPPTKANTEAEKTLQRSTTPATEPPSELVYRFRRTIWQGAIRMPDIATFSASVCQIAGRSIASEPSIWSSFFPSKHSLIEGRLSSQAAVDYLLQVVNSAKNETLVFAAEANYEYNVLSKFGDKVPQDGLANVEALQTLMDYFKSSKRWGVVQRSNQVRQNLIKDYYVVPLSKDDSVPVWLDLIESDSLGREWSSKRDRDLLLIVAVVFREGLEAKHTKTARKGSQSSHSATHHPVMPKTGQVPSSHQLQTEPFLPPEPTQAATVSSTITSTALQDLLKSIGKSTLQLQQQQQQLQEPTGNPPAIVSHSETGPTNEFQHNQPNLVSNLDQSSSLLKQLQSVLKPAFETAAESSDNSKRSPEAPPLPGPPPARPPGLVSSQYASAAYTMEEANSKGYSGLSAQGHEPFSETSEYPRNSDGQRFLNWQYGPSHEEDHGYDYAPPSSSQWQRQEHQGYGATDYHHPHHHHHQQQQEWQGGAGADDRNHTGHEEQWSESIARNGAWNEFGHDRYGESRGGRGRGRGRGRASWDGLRGRGEWRPRGRGSWNRGRY